MPFFLGCGMRVIAPMLPDPEKSAFRMQKDFSPNVSVSIYLKW